MKRLIAMLLCGVLTVGMLSGCGSKDSNNGAGVVSGDNDVNEETTTIANDTSNEKTSDSAENTAYEEGETMGSYLQKNRSAAYKEYEDLMQKANFKSFKASEKVTVGDFVYIYSEEGKYANCVAYIGSDEHVVFPAEVEGRKVLMVELYTSDDDYQSLPARESIKSITLEEGILAIDNNDAFGGFNHLENLEEVSLPESLVLISSAFNITGKLQELKLPGNLFAITESFDECESLTNITIPASVAYIDGFEECRNLQEVIFESNESLLILGRNAFRSSAISVCELPDSVHIIGSGALAFTKLENFHVPENLVDPGNDPAFAQGYRVMDGTPYMKNSTEEFIIWNNCLVAYLGDETIVTIPDGVTKIAAYAFNGSDAEEIILPESVTVVNREAFENMYDLKKLTISGELTRWGDNMGPDCLNFDNLPAEFSVTLPEGSIAEEYFREAGVIISYK